MDEDIQVRISKVVVVDPVALKRSIKEYAPVGTPAENLKFFKAWKGKTHILRTSMKIWGLGEKPKE
jgi:hypothetical protein